MSKVIVLADHRAAPFRERAAISARSAAVSPAAITGGAASNSVHHSDGIRSRCHHFDSCDGVAPIASAAAGRDDQRSMMARNVVGESIMHPALRRFVLTDKDGLSADLWTSCPDNAGMTEKPAISDFKSMFLARTKFAREASGKTQQEMADALGVEQSHYAKYETRSPLPHHLIVPFCTLCEITPAWLYSAAITGAERKPRRRRTPQHPKKASIAG
ncbi:helix-turn-helix domain-containing protein [Rhodopseudomonas palustris]|uniref:helix-turn-helix domain-containing protein n=1 Tax=Rhodopseudomonas palustris TaxID=1076 RepID=UPI0011B09182|nr:helix-turn-helix transcriptional regulator [Rhodopseudomonas palustris]